MPAYLLSGAMHSVQSQTPSNFHKNQEEDFQATHHKEKKNKIINQHQEKDKLRSHFPEEILYKN